MGNSGVTPRKKIHTEMTVYIANAGPLYHMGMYLGEDKVWIRSMLFIIARLKDAEWMKPLVSLNRDI